MKTQKFILITALPMAVIALLLLTDVFVETDFFGHFEGIYLLKDPKGNKFELTDHLYVGREKQILYAIDFTANRYARFRQLLPEHREDHNHLHCEWNPRDGSGIVTNQFPDGTALVTYLGRYLDDNQEVHGLFVGGGLPETVESNVSYNMNNSGMTYFDGKRWYHIWCSVNEGITSALSGKSYTPSKWEFIGSGLEKKSDRTVVITSSHRVVVDTVPLRIDRRMTFTAGEYYLNLEIRITNIGTGPLNFKYLYGDEPWVGFYGTSLGDVGWTKDGIVSHEEFVDTTRHTYVGIADLGNRAIGEQPVYTNLADFIEWFGPERPDFAYFTNNLAHLPIKGSKVPLESNERFVGLQWDNMLAPEQSKTIRLAVGMAFINPKTGLPEKPPTYWK
jgi:hypothetical protein